jgi:hypothetical protein
MLGHIKVVMNKLQTITYKNGKESGSLHPSEKNGQNYADAILEVTVNPSNRILNIQSMSNSTHQTSEGFQFCSVFNSDTVHVLRLYNLSNEATMNSNGRMISK